AGDVVGAAEAAKRVTVAGTRVVAGGFVAGLWVGERHLEEDEALLFGSSERSAGITNDKRRSQNYKVLRVLPAEASSLRRHTAGIFVRQFEGDDYRTFTWTREVIGLPSFYEFNGFVLQQRWSAKYADIQRPSIPAEVNEQNHLAADVCCSRNRWISRLCCFCN